MSPTRTALLAVIAVSAAASLAHAADQQSPATSPARSAANEDFGMLSKQGAVAFHDVHLARLAIFDGQISKAKQYLSAADSSFAKARNDAAYTKAESDLTPPSGVTQPKDTDTDAAMTGPVKWLPVDGAMAVDEDYDAVPAKKAGVAKADAQIKNGDRKGAMETLKLAGVDITFDMEVIPLERSISKAQNATTLLANGQYYEANQALRGLENGARFDIASYNGAPKTAGAAAPQKAG